MKTPATRNTVLFVPSALTCYFAGIRSGREAMRAVVRANMKNALSADQWNPCVPQLRQVLSY